MEELIKLTLINLHGLLTGLDMELDEIYRIIEKYGFILTTDAERFLEENYEYLDQEKLIRFLSLHKDLFIKKDDVSKLILKKRREREKIHTKIRILFDPTKLIVQGQGMDDYSSLFRNRFEILSKSIEKNIKIGHVIPLSSLPLKKKPGEVEDAYVIGMLYAKKIWEDKALIELEDFSGRQRIYIFRKREPKAFIEVTETPLDSVIGLHIRILPSGLYTIKGVFYPSVKAYGKRAREDVFAVFTSDLHIGSVKFHEDEFRSFIDILNGRTDDYKLKKIVERVKYMVIGGDLVEGVGVFPDQKKELLIRDIREQYLTAYKILRDLRQDIKVIIIPGNHDATRRSLPQPAIFEEFAKEFYSDRRFYMLGNPANIYLHGVNVYIYHGDFIHDLFTITPGLSRDNIKHAISILLKTRHVAPTYGLGTLIAPEKKDLLIIPEKIDIFHVGHTHKLYVGKINNILTINSGTWQDQTNYQKIYGIIPDPLKVPIVNLKTMETFIFNLSY